jgi:hypothetical protein
LDGKPLFFFGKTLDAMHEWHTKRGIRALHLTGRRDENSRNSRVSTNDDGISDNRRFHL